MLAIESVKIGQLDALLITGTGYQALLTLQGCQLLYFAAAVTDVVPNQFSTDPARQLMSPDNWLWVSAHARFERGLSVRGGVPICWPVFGVFTNNPPKVQACLQDCPFDVSKHGFVRTQNFKLTHQRQTEQSDEVTLTLANALPNLRLSVIMRFNSDGFGIETLTENTGEQVIHFSQALHTYLPTSDITNTSIRGFDGAIYADATTSDDAREWLTKMQTGDVAFSEQTDRIYLSRDNAPTAVLITPNHRYTLTPTGSKSTVIWNPWATLAKELADSGSQFGAEEYQNMLCIETANAHTDFVSLPVGASHRLGVWVGRDKIDEIPTNIDMRTNLADK